MPIILDGTTGITTPGITNTGTFVFRGPVQVPAGSAATASITTAAGANTGIFFPSSSSVAITTAGTQRFVVDSAGNAGLGVTPSAWNTTEYKALQIGVGGSFYGRVSAGDAEKVGMSGNSFFDQTDSRWEYIANDFASRYDQLSGGHYWFTAPSGTAGNAITFTQAMTLTADVQLGIGTTSPSYPLQVRRAGGACSLGLNMDNYGAIAELARSVFYYAIGDSTTDKTGHLFFTRDATATDNLRVVINSSGRVGINVSEPSTTFNVGDKSHGIGIAYINSSTLSSVAGVYTTSSGWGYGYGDLILKARTDYGGFYNIIFSTASSDNTPVERARITSGGNFGIGTSNPATKLEIVTTLTARSFNGTVQRQTSDQTFNILSVSNLANNATVAIYFRIVAAGPVSNDACVIEGWAAASRQSGGSVTYTAVSPVVAKAIVGSSISAGSLAWSGSTLQYTTSATTNYVGYHFDFQTTAFDGATVTFFP